MTDEEVSQAPEAAAEQVAAPVTPETLSPAPTEPETAQIPESEPLAPAPQPSVPPATPAPATGVMHAARDLLVKARATIQFRKTAKLEKILTALQKKNHITNDEVEKLLHVSDATATRYLEALVKQGKIKKVGTTGKAVTYTKS